MDLKKFILLIIYQNRNFYISYYSIKKAKLCFFRYSRKIFQQYKEDISLFLNEYLNRFMDEKKLIGCDCDYNKKNKFLYTDSNKVYKWDENEEYVLSEKLNNLIDEFKRICKGNKIK